MKILSNKKALFSLALLAFFSAFLLSPSFLPLTVRAKEEIGTCDPNIPNECGAGYRCERIGSQYACTAGLKTSLQEFQETIKTAREAGEMPRERWIGDSQSGVISDTINGLLTTLTGELNWDQVNKMLADGNLKDFRAGGALGFGSYLVSSLLTRPPVSGVEYLADLGKNFGIAKPAYAQGVGFTQLSNLLPLWKAFRNVAYFFFVIIFIIIGLAIMFRVKIDPKTVISIQNAIPKLVIALILVTFSYAIAGLLIDIIYLILYLGALVLGQIPGVKLLALRDQLIHMNLGTAFGYITGGLSQAVFDIFGGIIGLAAVVGLILALVGGSFVGLEIFAASVSLPMLIAGAIALYLIFKLFLALLTAYVRIIILVIFAPLIIMMGALPGSSGGFSGWFKDLLQNILIFPAVAIVIAIGNILSTTVGPSWSPPVLGLAGGALNGVLAFGILLLVANVPQMIQSAFAKKPFDFDTALGATTGVFYKTGQRGWETFEDRTGARARREAKKKVAVEDEISRIRGVGRPP